MRGNGPSKRGSPDGEPVFVLEWDGDNRGPRVYVAGKAWATTWAPMSPAIRPQPKPARILSHARERGGLHFSSVE